MAFGIYFAPRSVRAIFAYPLRMILEFVTTYAITMKGSVAAASHQDSRIAHPAAVTNRVRRLRRKGASEADDMMKKHRRDIERDYPLPALNEKLRVSQGGFGPAEYVLLHHRQAGDRPHWRRWVFREVGPALND
jgi:hypothetical protein